MNLTLGLMLCATVFLVQFSFAQGVIEGKEVGVQFITGTTASDPIEAKIHKQGLSDPTPVFNSNAQVTMGASEIVIDFGDVTNPIVFSDQFFSGLRFYDVSELDFLDSNPAVALPSLEEAILSRGAGMTDVEEANGDVFSSDRLSVDENNIYVNFSGLTVSQATGTKVVISLIEPVPLTALEMWRVTHFGGSEGEGLSADDADADGDGVLNLIEYATEQDPNDSTESNAFTVRESLTNPGEIEVVFNRIADPLLTYRLEGSRSLMAGDWTLLESVPGASAGEVIVDEAVWPADEDNYFFRLGVSREN